MVFSVYDPKRAGNEAVTNDFVRAHHDPINHNDGFDTAGAPPKGDADGFAPSRQNSLTPVPERSFSHRAEARGSVAHQYSPIRRDKRGNIILPSEEQKKKSLQAAKKTYVREHPNVCAPMQCPSLMQTHAQGPWAPGRIGPLSKDELAKCKVELAEIKEKTGWAEPNRGDTFDDPDIVWRFGGPPDYTLANLEYFKYKTKHHAQGSLEDIVENIVKTWEFERSHKLLAQQHTVANHEGFALSANGGRKFSHLEAHEVGNYNALLESADKNLWDVSQITNRMSHDMFHAAFPSFSWEILKVYTGPPEVHFEWRHFGRFTGIYPINESKVHQGDGQLVDVRGFGVAKVNAKLELLDTQIFYDQEAFLKVMRGELEQKFLCPTGAPRAIDQKKNWVKPETSLYARIGKGAAVGVAVELFYQNLCADPSFKGAVLDPGLLNNHDLAAQKAHLGGFLTVAFGGPDNEHFSAAKFPTPLKEGGMEKRHAKAVGAVMALGGPDAVWGIAAPPLVQTLKDLRLCKKEINEIVEIASGAQVPVLLGALTYPGCPSWDKF